MQTKSHQILEKIDLNMSEIAYFMVISGFCDLDLQTDN